MNFMSFFSKRNVSFVSLVALMSLSTPQAGFSMDNRQPPQNGTPPQSGEPSLPSTQRAKRLSPSSAQERLLMPQSRKVAKVTPTSSPSQANQTSNTTTSQSEGLAVSLRPFPNEMSVEQNSSATTGEHLTLTQRTRPSPPPPVRFPQQNISQQSQIQFYNASPVVFGQIAGPSAMQQQQQQHQQLLQQLRQRSQSLEQENQRFIQQLGLQILPQQQAQQPHPYPAQNQQNLYSQPTQIVHATPLSTTSSLSALQLNLPTLNPDNQLMQAKTPQQPSLQQQKDLHVQLGKRKRDDIISDKEGGEEASDQESEPKKRALEKQPSLELLKAQYDDLRLFSVLTPIDPKTLVDLNQTELSPARGVPHRSERIKFLDSLIRTAKNKQEDQQDKVRAAQDLLIELFGKGMFTGYLTFQRVGFLKWKEIQTRCQNNDSYTWYALCSREFSSTHPLFTELEQSLQQRAEQRNLDALCNLAYWYKLHDDLNYLPNLQLASNQGNRRASRLLAQDKIEKKEFKEALEILKPLAEQGNIVAHRVLGDLWNSGELGEKNREEAYKYYKLAAEQGNAYAQERLGFLCLQIPSHCEEGTFWIERAAEQECPTALCTLGSWAEKRQNNTKAVEYWKLAATHGYKDGYRKLGEFYQKNDTTSEYKFNAICHLMQTKDLKYKDYIVKNLSISPRSMPENMSRETALVRIDRFLQYVDNQITSEESNKYKIEEIVSSYKKIDLFCKEIKKMQTKVNAQKEHDFMIPGLKISLPNTQKGTREDKVINGDIYICLGNKASKRHKKFRNFRSKLDVMFFQVQGEFNRLLGYYGREKYESALRTFISKRNDPEEEETCNALNEKMKRLQGPLQELQEKCEEFREIKDQVKNWGPGTAYRRQRAFLEEYPFFSEGQ